MRTRPAPVPQAAAQAGEGANPSNDVFLDHYFKRLDPEVAASFSAKQREAIKVMFGARGIARHKIEVRRSVPFGRRRFYVVLLLGPERRAFSRFYSEGAISLRFNILVYLGLGALSLAPVLALLYGFGL